MRRFVLLSLCATLLVGCTQISEMRRLRTENSDWQRRIGLMKQKVSNLSQASERVDQLEVEFTTLNEKLKLAVSMEAPEMMPSNLEKEVASLAGPLGVEVEFITLSELEADSDRFLKRAAELQVQGPPEGLETFLRTLAQSGLERRRPVRLKRVDLKPSGQSLGGELEVDFYIRGFSFDRNS